MRSILVLFLVLFMQLHGFSQKLTRQEYIEKYKEIAINKMIEYKIPASITLAQGILESGNGNSKLARRAKNHFGIKCHSDWSGRTFYHDDDERGECFRRYKNPEASFRDHSLFLTTRDRYAHLFKYKINDYKKWAHGLKKAGYATNPKYPNLLIKIIEENKLFIYDDEALARIDPDHPNRKSGEKYYLVSAEDFTVIETGGDNRNIYKNNKKKFIIARKDDTFESIADEFNMYTWQIFKYNDLERSDRIREGQMLYLQRKKGRSKEFKFHMVKKEETMYGIAQQYGIRLKRLYKRNDLNESTEPKTGTRLKLR